MKVERLAAGDWEATLLPALGGAVGSLRYGGRDILRPTPPGATDPLQTACFPLVPYANRIAHGRFTFDGQTITLPPNFGDHPHPLHGVGWGRKWQVERHDAASVTLRLDHAAEADWPWSFAAEQRIVLAGGLHIALTLRSCDDRRMPAGLGFHPYFLRDSETQLQMDVKGTWLTDAAMLPTKFVPGHHFGIWARGDRVDRRKLVDNCHAGWNGRAGIQDGKRAITVNATGAEYLHLYIPPAEDFFCIEPVTHAPDAINRQADSVRTLAPGCRTHMDLCISWDPRPFRK
ncbi:aldose 1-epimerase [Sphingomonas naphthae]|uniref:Aldose 1-epimerase n=1 Tax=Sphingomonas naphthae TaxID=1813468 RepID=A0ABY7TMN5_9SPHN|nr:aldose 1-epimerase [Sphingomonas naphthae]WCT73104.1 aldose 1-epimerase [Sphingomonas naphthae]